MLIIEQNFSQKWFKEKLPENSENILVYSQNTSACKVISEVLSKSLNECILIFKAVGLPGYIDDISSVMNNDCIYLEGDAKKFFIKRFPELICQIEKDEICKVLQYWTRSICERRFIYCINRDSLDYVISYFKENAYNKSSNCFALWEHLECLIENVPEFDYDKSFLLTTRDKYLKIIKKECQEYKIQNGECKECQKDEFDVLTNNLDN